MNNNDLEAQSENNDFEEPIDVDIELDEDVVELIGIGGQKPLKKKKLKSKVWNFFNILPLGPDKKLKSACKKCGQQYLAASKYGTGNMLKHIKTCLRSDIEILVRCLFLVIIACRSALVALILKNGVSW